MIQTFEVTVPAPGGEQKRTAYAYLPADYPSDGGRYPALYLFDGQTAFFDETAPYGESWRMGETLDRLGVRLLVFAVDCDPTDRLSEYSPFPFESPYGSSAGKGERYLRWLTETFKPMMDETYRTLPDREHTFLAGSSMGGLMSLFGLCRFPEIFGGAAALSPSLWVAPEACAKMLSVYEGKGKLYLDYGERELRHRNGVQSAALTECLGALLERNIPFVFRLVAGGAHNEATWRKQIPDFLRALGILQDRPQDGE